MKNIALISVTTLACLSLVACSNTDYHKSHNKVASSSKVVKHHKKSVNKKDKSTDAQSYNNSNSLNQNKNNTPESKNSNNQQQAVQQSNSNEQEPENLHIIYSDKANGGKGGLVSVYNHGDDQQTNEAANQYGESIAQNGGSGDYHYN